MNRMKYDLAPLGFRPAGADLAPGQVALANSELMRDTFFAEPETQYAVGWRTEDGRLEELLDVLAPRVKVSDMFQYRVENNAAAFAAVENKGDERALLGEFQTVQANGQIVTASTISKGLTTVVDKRQLAADPEIVNRKVAWLKRMLIRAEILRAASALNAAATNIAVTWGGANGTSPDGDIMRAINAGGNAAGFDPNTVVMPSNVWLVRSRAYGATNTAGAFGGYRMTPAELADWLAIDRLYVSRERYGDGVATAKKPILGNNVALVFNAQRDASPEDPSNIKRFWSPEMGGDEWAVWVQDRTSHLVYVTVSHYSLIAVTSSAGIAKLTVTDAT